MSDVVKIPVCDSRRGKGNTGCYCHHPAVKGSRTRGVFVNYSQCQTCSANPLVNLDVKQVRVQPEHRQAISKAVPKLKAQRIRQRRVKTPDFGPGTELEKLIGMLGLEKKSDCPCNRLKREMNQLGVDGCRKERERLLKLFRSGYALYSGPEKRTAAWNAIQSGLAWQMNPLDPLGSLFDLAVINAAAASLPADS